MEITATPLAHTKRLKFDVNDVKQVYHGRLDNCRCGCAGDYYVAGEHDTEIFHALELLKRYSDASDKTVLFERFTYKDPKSNELYFEIKTETRDFAQESDDGEGEDYDDYYQRDEGDVGYGFYIQD
jgi:hypothetical protein